MAAPLVLIGFMGAGKTTLAHRLAAHRAVAHVDTDALLEAHFGVPIAEVFARDGEAAFRAAEEEIVLRELAAGADRILSLGGGAVLSERVRAALADCLVVAVDVDVDTAWERCAGAAQPARPLAADRADFVARHAARTARYDALATAWLPQADPDVIVRADPALRLLSEAPPGTRMMWASSASAEYPVYAGRGVLRLDLSSLAGLSGRSIVVTDSAVAERHLGALRDPAGVIEFPPGEEHKTLQTAERVWRALVAQEATRADHLVALGGGVVGDLAGFCASTFQRGVPVVQAPTTVVSQVDSAYGGKTGVDLPEAKNYVGTYHQPAAVLVDPGTLATLPDPEHAAGYAEVVKTALIRGGALWDRIAAGDPVDEEIIVACARTKLAVVAADERDGGRRQVLNLGHTVGHALETVLGYGTLRHGEAVGLGLLAALRLSGQAELRDQVAGLLAAHGLPTALPTVDTEAILAATRRDKKRTSRAKTPFVLARAVGDVVEGQPVGDDELRAAVEELAT